MSVRTNLSIRIKGAHVIEGDASSVAVIYNNLAGLNSLPDPAGYLAYMGTACGSGDPCKAGDLVECLIDEEVMASCRIGDVSPVWVTEAMVASHQA